MMVDNQSSGLGCTRVIVTNHVPAMSLYQHTTTCQESPLRQSGTYVAPGRGAWAETMGRGQEGTDRVVGQRGDDSSDAKPHAQHAGGGDYRGGKTGARARASGQNEIET